MSKVYVVTEGEYSAYHIVGVFDSLEKAQAFRELFWDEEQNFYRINELIEEYDLNPYQKEVDARLKRYIVLMSNSGDVKQTSLGTDHYDELTQAVEYVIRRANRRSAELLVFCWAQDQDHAIKIANEKRAWILANNLWSDTK